MYTIEIAPAAERALKKLAADIQKRIIKVLLKLEADPLESKTWLEAFHSLENREVYRIRVEEGLQWLSPMRGRRGWERHLSDIQELMKGI